LENYDKDDIAHVIEDKSRILEIAAQLQF